MSPCMWKENRGMNESRAGEGEGEGEMGTKNRQSRRNIFLLWKMKGAVEKRKEEVGANTEHFMLAR